MPTSPGTSSTAAHASAKHLEQDGRINASHPPSHPSSPVTMPAVLNILRIHPLIVHSPLLRVV